MFGDGFSSLEEGHPINSSLWTMTVATHECSTKREWHALTTLHMRRRVLLQILLVLKTKYGKVDAKMSYIARRTEVALYSHAFSLREYRNPKTLNRRLHSLVIKLRMNNLAAHEEALLSDKGSDVTVPTSLRTPSSVGGKRAFGDFVEPCVSPQASSKRLRMDRHTKMPLHQDSTLFFYANHDVLRHLCSFLSTPDQLRLSATNISASRIVPQFIAHINITVSTLEKLQPWSWSSLFDRFVYLQVFEVHGDTQSHLHFNFQNELALVRRNVVCRRLLIALAKQPLAHLQCIRWHYAFVDGMNDSITNQLAELLTNFPQLSELSLVGNAISDDGALSLCNAISSTARMRSLHVLNLEHNFIGERGQVGLERLLECEKRASCGLVPIVIRLEGNLLTPSPAIP